jgi:hypothetical protein
MEEKPEVTFVWMEREMKFLRFKVKAEVMHSHMKKSFIHSDIIGDAVQESEVSELLTRVRV